MSTLDLILQTLHNLTRWVVIILAVIALARAFSGWLGKKTYTSADARSGSLYAGLFDLQLLLGVILFFTKGWFGVLAGYERCHVNGIGAFLCSGTLAGDDCGVDFCPRGRGGSQKSSNRSPQVSPLRTLVCPVLPADAGSHPLARYGSRPSAVSFLWLVLTSLPPIQTTRQGGFCFLWSRPFVCFSIHIANLHDDSWAMEPFVIWIGMNCPLLIIF